jgi:hypothetical protein
MARFEGNQNGRQSLEENLLGKFSSPSEGFVPQFFLKIHGSFRATLSPFSGKT